MIVYIPPMPIAQLKAIPRMSAEILATDSLRRHLLAGAVRSGDRLTEIRLSAELGVSRATVRTALHQLAQEGLISQIPYSGWAVAGFDAHDAWELFTLHAGIEALAARLAARANDPHGKSRLRASFDRLAEACRTGDQRSAAEADYALHADIIFLSRHRRLGEQYRLVEQQIRLCIASGDGPAPEIALLAERHRPILDAIEAGDGARAARFSEGHNLKDRDSFLAYLKTNAAAAGRSGVNRSGVVRASGISKSKRLGSS
jgi:DNA-binding GntR family transcriptional regulator